MQNPWLEIPLADYEGHMASEAVRQLEPLAVLFSEVLARRQPESVALLGVAGGNGLDRIDCGTTHRIVGVDCNPSYIDAVRERFSHLRGLELHCVDLAAARVELGPVELVHAALVFEHAGTKLCLENSLSLVAAGGAISIVLQLPATADANVGSSGIASIQKLKNHFHLIDPEWLCDEVARRGFELSFETCVALAGGKGLWMGIFLRL